MKSVDFILNAGFGKSKDNQKCPSCEHNTMVVYDNGSTICGWCWEFTYPLNNNMKYICIKTFVSENQEFRRYYYGEEISESVYFMLSGKERTKFKKK